MTTTLPPSFVSLFGGKLFIQKIKAAQATLDSKVTTPCFQYLLIIVGCESAALSISTLNSATDEYLSDLFFSVAFFTIFANNGFFICFTGTLSLSCICKTSYLLPKKGNLPTNN